MKGYPVWPGRLLRLLALSAMVMVMVMIGLGPSGGGSREKGSSLGATAHASNSPPRQDLRVRKSVKALSPEEKAKLVAAIQKLKTMPSPYEPGLSYYDQFPTWHTRQLRCGEGQMGAMGHIGAMGHMGPDFLPWHRVFVLEFERALAQAAGEPLSVPYWDWTDPAATAVVFADDFMGRAGRAEDGYAVLSGPFRRGAWEVTVHAPPSDDPGQFRYLVRAFGTHPLAPTLPTVAEVEAALAVEQYDTAPWDITVDPLQSFRGMLEGWSGFTGTTCDDDIHTPIPGEGARNVLHNAVHLYVGGEFERDDETVQGTMVPSTSPNDPVFFLHHSNIDRIWALWEDRHTNSYAPVAGGPPGNNVNDAMVPWTGILPYHATIASVLDIRALGYRYDDQ